MMSNTKIFVPNLPELKELRESLAALIEEAGITQQELSERLGSTQSEISRLLNPRMYPTFIKKFELLRSIVRNLIEVKLAKRGLELSEEICGIVLDGTEIDSVLQQKKPVEHRQLPTKRGW